MTLLISILCFAVAPGTAARQDQRDGASADGDWLVYNRTLAGDRFSPLAEITRDNVARLGRACTFETEDKVSLQSGILAVDGVLYFTAFRNTYAVDGATCRLKWKQTREERGTYLKVNRGPGYAGGVLFRGTGDAHVLALDAKTGHTIWDVPIGDAAMGESVPMAPVAWNGLLFVGNAGGDNFDVRGRILALDARTGRTVWRFDVVPTSGPEVATWGKASPRNPPGGGATWTSYALDEVAGILYVSTGNPAPDFLEELHPGANLYATSVLALDAKTGRLIAYVQPTVADRHDWDLAASPLLLTTKSGASLVAAAGKDGYVHGIDRASLDGAHDRQVGILPLRYRTPVSRHENDEAPFTTERATRFCPGTSGGVEWNGPAWHPELGLLFVNSIDWCTSVRLQHADKLKGKPGKPWSGADSRLHPFGTFDPPERWNGHVVAIDTEDGSIRWDVKTPTPMVAGITATAGGLLFTGDLQGRALAYDAETGKLLWQDALGRAMGGGVISYSAGSRQHVAVLAGLNSPIWPVKGGRALLAVYSLP